MPLLDVAASSSSDELVKLQSFGFRFFVAASFRETSTGELYERDEIEDDEFAWI
jgi:hypothetical protein